MKTVGVVLVAGSSTRFKGDKQKQLCLLNGKAVFTYSIDAMLTSGEIDELVVVTNKLILDEISNYIKSNNLKASVILGGDTRQKSVENAMKAISMNDDDIILITDGARPLIDNYIIKSVKDAAIQYGASTAYIEETDTISVNDNGFIKQFINRKTIAKIQTPQGFKFGILEKAHKLAKSDLATDDCSLVASLGNMVKLVPGSKKYHKITTREDIYYLEGLTKND